MTTFQVLDDELLYPSSDGEPMADSTKQYEWIVRIKENLERLFASDRDLFIAADLLWYPQQIAIQLQAIARNLRATGLDTGAITYLMDLSKAQIQSLLANQS